MHERSFKLYKYQIIWPLCFYFHITLHLVQISGRKKRKKERGKQQELAETFIFRCILNYILILFRYQRLRN